MIEKLRGIVIPREQFQDGAQQGVAVVRQDLRWIQPRLLLCQTKSLLLGQICCKFDHDKVKFT
jgi:hypothetical protein